MAGLLAERRRGYRSSFRVTGRRGDGRSGDLRTIWVACGASGEVPSSVFLVEEEMGALIHSGMDAILHPNVGIPTCMYPYLSLYSLLCMRTMHSNILASSISPPPKISFLLHIREHEEMI